MMEEFMGLALEQAKIAQRLGEVPVGAVIVQNGVLVSVGYNRREIDTSALAHAEIIAIENACSALGRWRLEECDLYVTLEPCPMCAGAIINSRIKRVIFGASDPKAGCYGSLIDFQKIAFNHSPEIISGVLKEQCSELLRSFFRELRDKRKEKAN